MTYRNIILLSSSQRNTGWLCDLAEKHIVCLHPENRDNLKNLAYAYLYFLKGEFERSLEHNSLINTDFFFFKTDVKNLLMKNYYELNYFEEAFSCIDAFKHFLSSNKELPEAFKDFYRTYIKLYEDLIKIKSGKSKKEPLFIKKEIEKKAHPSFKQWLSEKANELIEENVET